MKIKEIEVFDLYQDGTLVLKTNVDAPSADLRYAWYILHGAEVIFKSPYQSVSFTSYQVKEPGMYTIKGFVVDAQKNKERLAVQFLANSKTSPQLVEKMLLTLSLRLQAEWISGPFWKFTVTGEVPPNVQYAWYLYREGDKNPVHREMYSTCNEYVHQFEESGTYQFKVFVLLDDKKYSKVSDYFTVKQL